MLECKCGKDTTNSIYALIPVPIHIKDAVIKEHVITKIEEIFLVDEKWIGERTEFKSYIE